MEPLKHRHAGLVATDRLPVDRHGCRPQRRHGLADARVSLGPIEATAREKTHSAVPLAGDQAVAVVFDFVNPLRSDRGLRYAGRAARLDDA